VEPQPSKQCQFNGSDHSTWMIDLVVLQLPELSTCTFLAVYLTTTRVLCSYSLFSDIAHHYTHSCPVCKDYIQGAVENTGMLATVSQKGTIGFTR